jgi:CubicO group peptidase (beta-lactamase class C family)
MKPEMRKNNFKFVGFTLLFFVLIAALGSCKLGRFVVYNFADHKDYKKFPSRSIEKSPETFYFFEPDSLKPPKSVTMAGDSLSWREFLHHEKTLAFLIIKNDTLLAEDYFYDYDKASIIPSFSVAKSVISLLVGCAIEEGLIGGVDEPVTKYLPELADAGFDEVTIEHLLRMTSGLDFNESYVNPFGDAATYYYGRNLNKSVSKAKLEVTPGERFQYVSGNTQILTNILDQVLGEKTVSAYLEEKVWLPLGMEFDAGWSLDKKGGLEKGFCCLNARARDFAKIGRLYLNGGNWNGTQIVSRDWVERSTRIDTTEGSVWYYQYQWWQASDRGDFYAEGILGQFVYVNPQKNFIAVRLGKKYGDVNWARLMVKLAEEY